MLEKGFDDDLVTISTTSGDATGAVILQVFSKALEDSKRGATLMSEDPRRLVGPRDAGCNMAHGGAGQ